MKEEQVETNRALQERIAALVLELEKRTKEWDEESRRTEAENISLSTKAKEQAEINRALEERNATLTAELEKRGKDRDVRRTEREDADLSATVMEQAEINRSLEEMNAGLTRELEERNEERDEEIRRIKRENASLMTAVVTQMEISRSLEERTATLTGELEKANSEWNEEICRVEKENASLKKKMKNTSLSLKKKDARIKTELEEREKGATRMSQLQAELNDTRASVGSLVSLPERSRQVLGSISGNLESVLEECVICCEQLLSGIGSPSFGVTSYACGCSRSGHVRSLHVNCVVSMSNLKCPLCCEDIVLIAPSLMTSTAVRRFTVRKT